MSRFAQYYIRYRHELAPYEWEGRQGHLASLFEKDDSIEFYLGEGSDRKVYKHRVYHLNTARSITVMRFANDIDIPVERDFEPAIAKDEPSCFVIIDNRANLRTVAIQKRKKAFSNTRQVAKIISTVIDQQLNNKYCYGFEILPDYYPVDLFTVWQNKQAYAQSLRFGVPDMEKDEVLKMVNNLKSKNHDYFDDSLMGPLLEVLLAQRQAKYKGHYTVMPEDKKTALYLDKTSIFMRNLLTFAEATGEPVELVTSDGGTFRCFIDNDEDVSDKIVCHEFNDSYLEILFKKTKRDGSIAEPEDLLKAEGEVVELMNSMKHEVKIEEEEEQAA
ncbi:MAG: hypothetical protein IKH33_05510 [Bacteroidales bacterium]|nr:hypothetical protein [Bacteroidales bacterium]